MNDEAKKSDDQIKRIKPTLTVPQEVKSVEDIKPFEDDGQFKLVVTITEHYEDKDQALESYGRFSGGGENYVVLKQGNRTISEKGWGDRIDRYGHHSIDGKQHTIIYKNE
jgi:hypothetical protein